MSRGDAIEVRFVGSEFTSTARATKAGRRLVQAYKTRAKVQWMDIDEVTRGGRPTGNRLLVRLDQVASVIERKVDVPVPAKPVPLTKAAVSRLMGYGDRGGPTITETKVEP